MWMHAEPAADGTLVQYYKHRWSRRYVRLDADSRVYAERRGGGPERLPACSGSMLLLALVAATAICEGDVGEVVRVPALARQEPTLVEDLPLLLEVVERIADDIIRVISDLEAQAAATSPSE